MVFLFIALRRIGRGTLAAVWDASIFISVLLWDFSLGFVNVITPSKKLGHVVPEGHPGAGGVWPEYIPPREGDSRCSCPALNALANHGILPRDGRNLTFKQLTETVRASYNFAPSFCYFVPRRMAQILGRTYADGTLNLEDIDVHNGIEHDGSLTRDDIYHKQSQALPSAALVAALLRSATGPPPKSLDLNRTLTPADLAKRTGIRRREARASNPQFSLDTSHKVFGSANAATMLTIFGGRVNDLHTLLTEERLPQGWEPRVRARMGLTMNAFNSSMMSVELGIKEEVEGPILT
ncbi:chloroperoxidase-like protein [Artomyces pyxidatus]|uniref:Chloroperoxidase-like protein n=1 Tax=Artomyces pyxidatus TaxID=48021 RepID=A0ACB8T124_9AGAM|nr:chloroperoxidase-like protein [Artomyces pyxidatus]